MVRTSAQLDTQNEATNEPPIADEGRHSLSDILKSVFDPNRGTSTLGALVDELDHHGIAVVLVLFSIPSALPIPAAGYSTVLSIPLMLIGLGLLCGFNRVWLPEGIRKREFNPASFEKARDLMLKVVGFIERFSKRRVTMLTSSRAARGFLGLLICAMACSMALPVPLTNTAPAGGVFLIGFSLLEDDGLLALAGIVYSILAMCLTLAVIFLGYEAVKLGFNSLFG